MVLENPTYLSPKNQKQQTQKQQQNLAIRLEIPSRGLKVAVSAIPCGRITNNKAKKTRRRRKGRTGVIHLVIARKSCCCSYLS